MPRSRDLLNRFRPLGTPGAAGAAGVPVDHEARTDAELAPVFAALAPTEAACDAILDGARARAGRIRQQSAEEAGQVLAEARGRVGAERAAVVARLRERRAEESAAEIRRAEGRAAEIRAAADERLPGCVAEVSDGVRALIGEGP